MILNKIQSTVKVVQSFSRNERALVAKSQNGVSVSMCQCRVQSGVEQKGAAFLGKSTKAFYRYIHTHSNWFFFGLTLWKKKNKFLKIFAGHF